MTSRAEGGVLVGTRGGLHSLVDGAVTALCDGEEITALARAGGGSVFAAAASGSLLCIDEHRCVAVRRTEVVAGGLAALLWIPTHRPLLLAATRDGAILESADDGRTFAPVERGLPGCDRPITLAAVAGRAAGALALVPGRGIWAADDVSRGFSPRSADAARGIVGLAAHPSDPDVWLARTDAAVLRSFDGARTFRAAHGWPPGARPRRVEFVAGEPALAVAVAWPESLPPDPDEPSTVSISRDGGSRFEPVPSRIVDRARDPSGEITAFTGSSSVREPVALLFGTDRGELLAWNGSTAPARVLADGLPPITALLAIDAAPGIDPARSGVHVLP